MLQLFSFPLILAPLALFAALVGCSNPLASDHPSCGDGACHTYEGETPTTCPADCPSRCGDGACTGSEDNAHCPQDCAVGCGDGKCETGETNARCPKDCPAVCGDGLCNGAETSQSCPDDCQARTCGSLCTDMCGGCNACCSDGDRYFCVSPPQQCP